MLLQCLGIDKNTARHYQSLIQREGTRWICHVSAVEWFRRSTHWSPDHHVTYQLQPFLTTDVAFRDESFCPPTYGPRVQLMAKQNGEDMDQLSLGRLMDLQKVDIRLLRSWIDSCERHHAPDCSPKTWTREAKGRFRLIDVKRRCIVRAPSECRYIALSYCWGKGKHLKLEDATIVSLYSKGSLLGSQKIPRTIRDAIDLVHDLGERYLWVDALCIKQDDEADRAVQIPHMSKVYGSAICTIVAGTGSDAWAGLNGVGNDPIPRSPKQYSAKIKDLDLITTQKHYLTWKHETIWETRGWTFQEMVLSKRLLIFTDSQVLYKCKRGLWCENTILENVNASINCESKAAGDIGVESHTSMGAFTTYTGLLYNFTRRSLGCQGDALNSFLGIQQHLQDRGLNSRHENINGEFHYGLPESMFDIAMVWKLPYHYPKQRRDLFPSWSWAGWNMEMGETFRRPGITFPFANEVVREIVWYKPVEKGPAKFVPIDTSELATRDSQITADDKRLTEKWKSDKNPIPPYAFPKAPQIIYFWTSAARLLVDRSGSREKRFAVDPSDPAILENEDMAIRDPAQGILVGSVSLNQSWRADKPDELEFIVVARACNITYEQSKYGLYVMLIQWVDNVAYRVQMTNEPVKEAIWASLNTEWKLVSLG